MSKKEELLNKYLDNKLTEEEQNKLKELLSEDKSLNEELKNLKEMKEVMDMLKPAEPDREWKEYWSHLYNRLERGIGWIILSLGAILVLTFAGFQLIKDIISDPQLALYVKIGIFSLLLGLVILFVSVLRERIFLSKSDKYSKEVKR